jgi:alpha-tubulin suppressor-like RCC1 family protein
MFTTLTAWGDHSFGQLGDGTIANNVTTPVEVSNLGGAELKAIAAGSSHSLALKDDGTVWAWGDNQLGQLGDGTNANSNTPVQVSDLEGVKSIAADGAYSLAGE